MNRRNFLKNSALALFGFTVLPPAETYQRIWKAKVVPRINPAYVNAEYECIYVMDPAFLESCRKNLLHSGVDPTLVSKTAARWANQGGVYVKVFDRSQYAA